MTTNKKNKNKFLSVTAVCLCMTALIFGCGKKASELTSSPVPDKIENPKPQKLEMVKLGQSDEFAILAYASITSIPSSSINGKVGLMPGTREQIILEANEVLGGDPNIIGSDDETVPTNLLSNAKVDAVTAYKEAVSISPDADKVGLNGDSINGKILAPGCYKWDGDLTISDDFSVEGGESDVWIFKIPAHLKVGSNVRISLKGSAQARNILWQVSGGATLESGSVMAGTIIAQQFVEMKNRSQLTGRAFAKNGYVNLNQATINLP